MLGGNRILGSAGRIGGMEVKQSVRGRSGAVAFIVIAIAFMVPIAYVLLAGPTIWLVDHGYIVRGLAQDFYAPLRWLNERCPPFESAVHWYTSFFRRAFYDPDSVKPG